MLFICGLSYIAWLKIEWEIFEKIGHIKLCIVDIVTRFSQIIASKQNYSPPSFFYNKGKRKYSKRSSKVYKRPSVWINI